MKIVVIGVVALVIGLVGGTAFTVLRAPKRPPVARAASAAHADTTRAVAATPAATPSAPARPSTPPASSTSPAASAAPEPPMPTTGPIAVAVGHTSSVQVGPLGAPPATLGAVVAELPDTAHAEGFQQLGRIFAKMQTADAVKIMGYLDDEEVARVLGTLNVRQAAALLAAMPSDRAARLSKRIIQPPTQPAVPGSR